MWSAQPYQDIDSQLRTAAEAFLENDNGCLVDPEKKEVRLSQIFKWYKADFGGTDEKVRLTLYIYTDTACCLTINSAFITSE